MSRAHKGTDALYESVYDQSRSGRKLLPHPTAIRTLPSASKRIGAKSEIQIVGQHPDGKEDRVGLEGTAGHVFHAEADFQILDAVLARVAALRIPFHRDGRVFVRAIAGNGVIAIERLVLEQILLPRTSQDDQSERLLGLVHAMDRLGDFSVSEALLRIADPKGEGVRA